MKRQDVKKKFSTNIEGSFLRETIVFDKLRGISVHVTRAWIPLRGKMIMALPPFFRAFYSLL